MIVAVAQVALSACQADVVMHIQHFGLALDAMRHQPVVIAQKLDVLPPGLFQAAQQVTLQTQWLWIAQVTNRLVGFGCERLDDLLDLIITAVVADDDFEVFVTLVQGALQRRTEESRVERRDGDTD
ncbi:hypothetical protein D3C80_680920 [compost metagenome]